ncbi:LacI family DNA-binding transcriptional regulator [Streptomyces sp. NPDC049040]|uniref:LacI family DNA-binding transcriptional regulator n=1 Tax=Streptomyces sp. NPDC049040 TaxID=3365593 RepID=UPI0037202163
MRRATIRDVARRAGVSAAAVSLAFSGKAGVSPVTRRRIASAAADLDWHPSPVASALAGSAATHGGTVALAVDAGGRGRPRPWEDDFLAGALGELARAGRNALTAHGQQGHSAPAALRSRWQAGQICGAVLLDEGAHVETATALAASGIPAVAAAPARPGPCAVTTVWWDDRTAAETTLAYLAALGHRRCGYVADQAVHGRLRALRDAAAHRIELAEPSGAAGDRVVEAAHATRLLLSDPRPPTVVIYDTAFGAAAGLCVAREMAVEVPRSLSVLAWQDSVLCTLARPRITAMAGGMTGLGGHAVRVLLALLEGREAPLPGGAERHAVPRESVAPRR